MCLNSHISFPQNKCVHCSTLTNCAECSSISLCTKCVDSGYYIENGLCSLCQSKLPGCLECTISGSECAKCNIPKYYQTDSKACESCSKLYQCEECTTEEFCSICKTGYYSQIGKCKKIEPDPDPLTSMQMLYLYNNSRKRRRLSPCILSKNDISKAKSCEE